MITQHMIWMIIASSLVKYLIQKQVYHDLFDISMCVSFTLVIYHNANNIKYRYVPTFKLSLFFYRKCYLGYLAILAIPLVSRFSKNIRKDSVTAAFHYFTKSIYVHAYVIGILITDVLKQRSPYQLQLSFARLMKIIQMNLILYISQHRRHNASPTLLAIITGLHVIAQ